MRKLHHENKYEEVKTEHMTTTHRGCAVIITFFALLGSVAANETKPTISKAKMDENGFLVHSVRSSFQAGTVKICVLLPDNLDSSKKYPVLYVLPVEARDDNRYGDGLLEAKRTDLHNKHQLICVAPTFSHLPWYADHPTDKGIQQDAYFVKVVVPFIDRSYAALAERKGRLLVGFSKSGWGAWTLLLQHPEVFQKAAAWDAPLMKAAPNQFGMGPIFGTQENFQKYEVTRLLAQRADVLRKTDRLVLTGYGGFREHHQQAHQLLEKLGIGHQYRDGPQLKHHWNSGWLEEAVDLLVEKRKAAAH
jgi:enterochelin esterase-like enzyme